MGTVKIDGEKITLPKLTADPTLAAGILWARDTNEIKWSPDSTAVKVVHPAAWDDITGKPSAYPPEAHTHTKSDITDFAHDHSGDTLNPAAINVGDIGFKNGWKLTEDDEHGLVLVSPEGRKYALMLKPL